MATMAAKMVSAYFETRETPLQAVTESGDVLTCGWDFQGGSIRLFFFFDDDAHVHTQGVQFAKIPESAYDKMYKLMNDLNAKYKLAKFVFDAERGDIKVEDDAVVSLDTCGEEMFEIMIRIVKIVEDAFPTIQRAIWA